MGKKSGPTAPPPPDPVATTNAQAAANTQAAITQANLNRVNQYTPQGSLTWSQIGTNSDGTPRWQSNQTYSPEQQALYDQQTAISRALSGLAGDNIQRVNDAQSRTFNFDNMTPFQSRVEGGLPNFNYGSNAPSLYSNFGNAGPVARTFDQGPNLQYMQEGSGGNIQRDFANGGQVRDVQDNIGGDIQRSFANGGNFNTIDNSAANGIQNNLNYGNLPSLPGQNDFSADSQRIQDAMYRQASSRLDPRFAQGEAEMRSRLAAQGISENSEAYRRELENFGRTRNDAYDNAMFSSIQAGGGEQSRLFGLALNARQQGQNEINSQGQFANQSQAQRYAQLMGIVNQNNQVVNDRFGQNQLQAQFGNQAQQQQYSQIANMLAQNNQTAGQQYAQNQGAASFWNSGQDQNYTQNMGAAEFANNAMSNMFQMQQQQAGMNNTARSQAYNEQVSNLNINNTARQRQIEEATYLRNLPLNEIAALLGTGGGVSNPNFANVSQVGVAAPDYQGAVYQNYNAAMQQYTAAQQARSQMMGSIFGTLGSLGGAAIMSDIRFKENIVPIMQDMNDVAWYTFNYIGDTVKRFGVMAQELLQVKPDAVIDNGQYLAVNYGELYA